MGTTSEGGTGSYADGRGTSGDWKHDTESLRLVFLLRLLSLVSVDADLRLLDAVKQGDFILDQYPPEETLDVSLGPPASLLAHFEVCPRYSGESKSRAVHRSPLTANQHRCTVTVSVVPT